MSKRQGGDGSLNGLTHRIIGAAIVVHQELGPGLLESGYESAMAIELRERGLQFERQVAIPAFYRGRRLDCSYRVDLLVERQVVVELKASQGLDPVHTAQVLTYLKLTSCQVGLLINFNVPLLKQGIKRIVNDLTPRDDLHATGTAPASPLILRDE